MVYVSMQSRLGKGFLTLIFILAAWLTGAAFQSASAQCVLCTFTGCKLTESGFINCKKDPEGGSVCSANCGYGSPRKPLSVPSASAQVAVTTVAQDSSEFVCAPTAVKVVDAVTKSPIVRCTDPQAATRDAEFWSNMKLGSHRELLAQAQTNRELAQALARIGRMAADKDHADSGAFTGALAGSEREFANWREGAIVKLPAKPATYSSTGQYAEWQLTTKQDMRQLTLNIWQVVIATEQPASGSSHMVNFVKQGNFWVIKNIESTFSMPERGIGRWGG